MFAQKGDDSETRLDSGPAATRECKLPPLGLLVNGTPHGSMDACADSAVNVLSSNISAQADSSIHYDSANISFQNFTKNYSEIISEKKNEYSSQEDEDSNDNSNTIQSLTSIDDKTDKDLFSPSNIENEDDNDVILRSVSDDTSGSMEASIVQSVPKLTQNFTLNVSPGVGVGNLAAIQNVVQSVSSGNQTLWLPTIITSGASAGSDQLYEAELEGPPTTVSQIILTGTGQHFTHSIANPLLSGNNCHMQSNHKYSSKVQILSSITIPKQGTIQSLPQANASNIKGVIHTNYISQNDINKGNTPVAIHNSVLNSQLANKGSLSSVAFSGRGQSIHSQSKSSNSNNLHNKSSNKLNNPKLGNNAISSPNQQSHVLSRVVPGPKMSLQSVGRGLKSNSYFQYNQKVSGRSGLFPNMVSAQNVSTALPVKIIQQQNLTSHNKSGLKTIPPNRTGITWKNSSSSISTKSWCSATSPNYAGNQKQGSHSKNVPGIVNVQKPNGKNSSQKLVLQQSSGRVIVSNNSQANKINSQYYQQPSEVDNTVRYIQNYLGLENNQSPNVSSNQNLTAQILQSLSQPKPSSAPLVQNPTLSSCNNSIQSTWEDHVEESDNCEQLKQIYGDPTTSLVSDDILGIEERPNLSDESIPYHYYSLQLVMLDHTYAVTTQSITSNTNNTNTPVVTNTPPSNNSMLIGSPTNSPTKAPPLIISSPINSNLSSQSPVSTLSVVPPTSNVNPIQNNYQFTNTAPRTDEDTASVLSSIDGDERRPTERNGSDTETAPEGEEEGKTRCVCDFTHDDGYMICCDRCGEWQHVDCMAIDRQNIPDDYMCDNCQPRWVDRHRARSIQMRKREELTGLGSSASDSSSGGSGNHNRNKKLVSGGTIGSHRKRPLTVTTYSNTVGGVSRTLPLIPTHQTPTPTYTLPNTISMPVNNNKRGPKRPRRADNGRKGPKRKLPEKKMRRKSDIAKYRNKYCAPPASSQQLTQWNESYESAMTNHYSPELRAKIARYNSNKVGGNVSSMGVVLTAHHCTTVPHAGGKILIATKDLKENTPIIELRGKYMLSAQHKPQPQPLGRAGSQRPGPYLFFYRFPKDSTQVCIDTRTYGNEARFVRRSCKPNAELQHCIIKGALHVYLMTINSVQSNTEITIRHEPSASGQPCACGNPKHCKQNISGSALTHRNNGASADGSIRERRGRTRHASTSSFSNLQSPTSSTPKENISPKQLLSPKLDRRRKSEPETVNNIIKQEVNEIPPVVKKEPIIEVFHKYSEETNTCIENDVSIKHEMKVLSDDKITNFIKVEHEIEEMSIKQVKQEETVLKAETPIKVLDTLDKIENTEIPEIPAIVESTKTKEIKTTAILPENTLQKAKECDKINKNITTRRTSTHSTRTTRASSFSALTAGESADEKSDSQSNSKAQSIKDKKKMTREERKMEAIMKAFERMEKAEQRKLENKDKQSKRRESDSQQPCSVTSTSESKDHPDQSEDNIHRSNLKGRPRRRGRSCTSSQSHQKSRNRLNSVDSDMVTSEDERISLLSPPRPSGNSISETYAETTPVSSTEEHPTYTEQELAQTSIDLGQSLQRIKVGLSSACLLVEAAVGPLEDTSFKYPQIKKGIMNEWLNEKSPETSLSYDIGTPLDFTSPTDNNNSSHYFPEKRTFLGGKSIENLVKVANTMIGTLSGGVISADSTPEKHCSSETSEPESYNAIGAVADSSCSPSPIQSLMTHSQKLVKRVARDLSRDSSGFSPEKLRTPKKIRKGLKCLDQSPVKRSLRSNAGNGSKEIENEVDEGPEERHSPARVGLRDSGICLLPAPHQHSAKKRWLRQAISEESDSPTAESPPNEMVTPLKKRRLARESLSVEPTTFSHSDDAQHPSTMRTPTKDFENELSFLNHSSIVIPLEMSLVLQYANASVEKTCDQKTADKVFNSKNNSSSITDVSTSMFSENKDMQEYSDTNEKGVDRDAIDMSASIKPSIEHCVNLSERLTLNDECVNKSNENENKDAVLKTYLSDETNNEQNLPSHMLAEDSKVETKINDSIIENDKNNAIDENKMEALDFSNFKSEINRPKSISDSRNQMLTDETNTSDKAYDSVSGESKGECVSNIHSAETSSNSSPILDEMDDIQKKIHSFHTENIQILKIRNKKQPKEKRKKVNLNFDLSVLDDQTVEVKLKTDKESHDLVEYDKKTEVITPIPEICQNISNPETPESNSNADTMELEDSNLNQNIEPVIESVTDAQLPSETMESQKDRVYSDISLNNNFPSAMLFSDSFRSKTYISDSSSSVEISASIPDLNVIKNAIDMTTSLDSSVFKDGSVLNSVDEYKNVQEILSRVNQMDSRNSVLLSGVLKDTNHSVSEGSSPAKPPVSRSNDPRLNPPPVEKPKPIRRKLSITEYRRRHSMVNPPEDSSPPQPPTPPPAHSPSPVPSPSTPPTSPGEEDISRIEKNLEESISKLDLLSNMNIGVQVSTCESGHGHGEGALATTNGALSLQHQVAAEGACPPFPPSTNVLPVVESPQLRLDG